jgi:predicted RND superfamily exporter protein
MRALANLVVKKPVAWAIVCLVLALAAVSSLMAARLENDDNLLAFLPKTNPDIKTFYEVNDRFGSLDVGLVGIASEDPLAPAFVAKLKELTKKLNQTSGVDYVLSLTSVEDFQPDPKGGIAIDYLVQEPPKDAAELAALRAKVMSRDQVVGNLISGDGKATVLYCFLVPGTDPKPAASAIRAAVDDAFPSEAKYWGGGPFIQSYIYSATEADLRKLTPWACIAVIVLAIASFRDALGSVLALFSTGVGIVVALAIMAACNVKANIVLGSMPVILFALGSAYPIHLLTRYYILAEEMGCEAAIKHTLEHLGPVIISTGLVTISGLLSFMAMDMAPMRTFGLFTAIGVLVTLVLAVTFVPAVVRLVNLKGKRSIERPTSALLVELCTTAHRRRGLVGASLGIIAVASALLMSRLDTRLDTSAFFSKTSPPAAAEAFLGERFGGSQFFQIQVEGDMSDPVVLREVRFLGDRIAQISGVTSVNQVADIVAKINEAMDGDERIPDTAGQVKLLYGFLEGKKAVRQLVTDDRKHALMQVKVGTDSAAELEALLDEVEAIVGASVLNGYVIIDVEGPRREEAHARVSAMVLARIQAVARKFGAPLNQGQIDAIAPGLRASSVASPALIKDAVAAYLTSDEFLGDLPEDMPDAADRIATALSTLGLRATKDDLASAIAKGLEKETGDAVVEDLAAVLAKPFQQIVKQKSALAGAQRIVEETKLALPAGPKGQQLIAAIGNTLMDLGVTSVALPAAAPAGSPQASASQAPLVRVTGLPVLNRGLSKSVARNQLESFAVAMGLVFVIALFLYRSIASALLALAPMVVTLLVVYGGMGLLGVRLDIGTSMLASLSIGAGVDYAVHLLAAWKAPEGGTLGDAATYSARLVGRAIWTNAVMVAAGFAVLTMGESKPLQNVGSLTAAAMIAAGLATFAVIPVFARRLRYDNRPRIAGIVPVQETERAPRDGEPPAPLGPDAVPPITTGAV